MAHYTSVSNAGSALGEAIGACMKHALEGLLTEVADQYNYYYLTAGVRPTKSGKPPKKLLMSDNFGNEYDIDGVIANEAMQPLILFESKYIRYKKHNRDKGSWLCNVHPSIRKRYHSIRSSIAVLAGNWSKPSLGMIKSHDITYFLIPFSFICDVLGEYGIDFRWAEKDKEAAQRAWFRFNELSEAQRVNIGFRMVEEVKDELIHRIDSILDETVEREIEKVIVELVSNVGEVKVFEFASVADAIDFLQGEGLGELFMTEDSCSLFDPPPAFEDEDDE